MIDIFKVQVEDSGSDEISDVLSEVHSSAEHLNLNAAPRTVKNRKRVNSKRITLRSAQAFLESFPVTQCFLETMY